jgi:hypothetical protein
MAATWAGRGIACLVMAGLVAGCMRPSGPSGLVRTPLKTADTPIVVTENAGDEEFWEFMFRAVDRPFLVLGGRDQCEAMRVEQKDVRPGPCIGPHYFKRTGPPDRS